MLKICLNALYCLLCVIVLISVLEWSLLKNVHMDIFRDGTRNVIEILHL